MSRVCCQQFFERATVAPAACAPNDRATAPHVARSTLSRHTSHGCRQEPPSTRAQSTVENATQPHNERP